MARFIELTGTGAELALEISFIINLDNVGVFIEHDDKSEGETKILFVHNQEAMLDGTTWLASMICNEDVGEIRRKIEESSF